MDPLMRQLVVVAAILFCCVHSTSQYQQHGSGGEGTWSEWSQWSLCSRPCGYGMQNRSRTYTYPSGDHTDFLENIQCFIKHCPVNGSWTQWGMWGECSKGCGGGVRKRHRSCSEPHPQFDGKNCTGEAYSEGVCNKTPCPALPVNFNMSQCSSSVMFMCASKLMCVHKSLHCDREAHCHDGSDEVGCRREDIYGHVRFNRNLSNRHSSSCLLVMVTALLSSWFVNLLVGELRHSAGQS